jgi:hypothetical protein
VTFLAFSASAVVVVGLLCLLQRLCARSASRKAPETWWHAAIAALLYAASVALIVYLTR